MGARVQGSRGTGSVRFVVCQGAPVTWISPLYSSGPAAGQRLSTLLLAGMSDLPCVVSHVHLQCNQIHHGLRSGIVILGNGKGIIRNNQIFSNKEAGIYILYHGNPIVRYALLYPDRPLTLGSFFPLSSLFPCSPSFLHLKTV